MKNIIWVGLGGLFGTLLRYGTLILFPSTGLWIVNIVGSFFLGLIFHKVKDLKKEKALFVTTGILGSFTTFSTFSGEWLAIMENSVLTGTLFGLGMTIICIVAAAGGFKLGGESKLPFFP
ncbi:MAG: CrcB family protein [Paenisporosarcina sp.]